MDQPILRPATDADVSGIQQLIAGIYAEYDCVVDLEGAEKRLLDPAGQVRPGGGEFWVVELSGLIVGSCSVEFSQDSTELKSLYIAPSIRRQGWGARLTRLAMEFARAAGRRRMVLWTDTRFLDAHRLYERLGFVRIGTRDLNDLNRSVEFGFEIQLPELSAEGL